MVLDLSRIRLMEGSSGAGYQSSWGMGNRAVKLLEETIVTEGIKTRP
jgi:hypothetical protein